MWRASALLLALTTAAVPPPLSLVSLNASLLEDQRIDIYAFEYLPITSTSHVRRPRESLPLIGPFDISKMFKKKPISNPKQEGNPSVSWLRVADHLVAGSSYPTTAIANSSRSFQRPHSGVSDVYLIEVTEGTKLLKSTTSLAADIRTTRPILFTPVPTHTSSVSVNKIFRRGNVTKSKLKPRLRPAGELMSANDQAVDKSLSGNWSNGKPSSDRVFNDKAAGRRGPRVAAKKKADNDTMWPTKLAAVVEGDIILGGLMMVHGRAGSGGRARCGPLMAQGGVQALEAMLFALDAAAALTPPLPPPGVTLGALILDDCDSDTRGLEMALDFIKDHQTLYNDSDEVERDKEIKTVLSATLTRDEQFAACVVVHSVPVTCNHYGRGNTLLFQLCAVLMTMCFMSVAQQMNKQNTDVLEGSISNIDDTEYGCNASAGRPRARVVSGVVGAASSVTSVQVANLLRLFKIPQVSFFSTSPELSNKARFEYFTRTIPSDLHQVQAMVEIVKKLGWRYVSIIYEESNYGIKAFEELETLLARNEICIAVKERLAKDSGAADERAYDAIVERLLSRPRARGVIVFGSDQEVAGVMAAVRRRGAAGAFSWVGSDGWSARALVAAGNEPVVEGTISVQPQANPVRGFRDYFFNLTVENNSRNPWFVEFWEEQFRCRYPGSPRTPYNAAYTRACSGHDRLSADNTEFEAQLQFVTDAVWAFIYAIRDMHVDLCGGKPGLCEAMRPTSGPTLLRYLRQVRFTGLSGDEFHFDNNGDGPARYNILHFKQVSRGNYRWLKVGRYLDGELELDMDEIQFKLGERRPPESVCSAECELGQAKQYVEGESCCWHCFNCTQYEIRSPASETTCMACARGSLPAAGRTHCARIPELYLHARDPAAIGAMAFSALGILLTMLVAGVWVWRGGTPVVRASGRELSCVLLAGILLCYLVTFALVTRPTDLLCAIQRFGTGFCFTVVYAALLTKTNRIARIFAASKQSARRPSLISPKSQLFICSALISIQVIIVIVWQIASPARAIHHYPTREDNMLVCDSYVDASYTIAFFYPVVLIVVCTVYAVLTRKIPEAFNESKHIGFTMYTTCVIWLAFVPLYFGTASHVPLRVTSMAVTISLSASVTLACLFAPKVYIILVRPERNVRVSLMPARWRGARGASGGAGGGAVCAALVGAAPLPRPATTPSTDFSTLDITERSTSTDRQVQTEETAIGERSPARRAPDQNGLALDPRKLVALALPPGTLPSSPGSETRRRAANEPARLTVAVVGVQSTL